MLADVSTSKSSEDLVLYWHHWIQNDRSGVYFVCASFFLFLFRGGYITSEYVQFLRGVLLLLYLSCYIRLFYVCWSYQRRKSTWHLGSPPLFLYLHKKDGFRLYCSPKQKNSLWWPQVGFFLIVAYFEKVKIIYVKIFFYIFIWQERNHLWFFCFEFQDKIFLIKTNGLSVQIAQTCHSNELVNTCFLHPHIRRLSCPRFDKRKHILLANVFCWKKSPKIRPLMTYMY